jgi:hypothetical protein
MIPHLPDRRLELFFSGRNNDRIPKPKPISRQNQKLTQQHNWKKGSSSPREAWAGYSSLRKASVS